MLLLSSTALALQFQAKEKENEDTLNLAPNFIRVLE